MRTIKTLFFLIVLAGIALIAYAWSGMYDVAVGTGHTPVTAWFLQTLRERSIETRAEGLTVPADLANDDRVRAGAGHYKEMCAGCHGYPGRRPTDHFDPAPPALYRTFEDPAEAFWIIRNGIKMTAMPQHRDHDEKDIWNIVAFVQRLPQMDADEYEALTAAAEHHHAEGDGEDHEHAQEGDGGDHEHAEESAEGMEDVEAPAPSPEPDADADEPQ